MKLLTYDITQVLTGEALDNVRDWNLIRHATLVHAVFNHSS